MTDTSGPLEAMSPAALEPGSDELRELFPGSHTQTYLDTASYGLPPRGTVDVLEDALQAWSAGAAYWPDDWDVAGEACRTLVAPMLGAQPEEVALLPAVSVGAGLVAASIKPGSRVPHPGGRVPVSAFPVPRRAARLRRASASSSLRSAGRSGRRGDRPRRHQPRPFAGRSRPGPRASVNGDAKGRCTPAGRRHALGGHPSTTWLRVGSRLPGGGGVQASPLSTWRCVLASQPERL